MMCITLQKVGVGGGSVVLDKLMKSVFNSYLDKYINDEKAFLKSKCESILAKFYESKNHQKKQIQTGGFVKLLISSAIRYSVKSHNCYQLCFWIEDLFAHDKLNIILHF